MQFRRIVIFLGFTTFCATFGVTQATLRTRPTPTPEESSPDTIIALKVPKGTALEIALSENVRVKRVGQQIHGRLVRPVYAFDRLVIPSGSEVTGRIARIDSVSRTRRTLAFLNGDLTPPRQVELEFSDIRLVDGKDIPFAATISPGSGRAIQLVTPKENSTGKKEGVHDAAANKIAEARQQARQSWQQAMKQVKDPGRLGRLKQYAMAQLPIRAQYLHAGTVYFADLQEPLDFGQEAVKPESIASIGTPPPAGSLAHALLVTPLDSATTQKGVEVIAVLSQPLLDGERLVLPEGSLIKGSVAQVSPARRWHHNGQLRIVFREVVPPAGIEQRVAAGLEGVQAGRDQHVKLDSEGGAEATSPRTRYASLALSLALTTAAFRQHNDGDAGDQSNNAAAGGTASFKLVGMAMGLAIKSQPVGMAMGAYGSARSVYSHFIAKGREVVFPRNTPMEISLAPPHKSPALSAGQ